VLSPPLPLLATTPPPLLRAYSLRSGTSRHTSARLAFNVPAIPTRHYTHTVARIPGATKTVTFGSNISSYSDLHLASSQAGSTPFTGARAGGRQQHAGALSRHAHAPFCNTFCLRCPTPHPLHHHLTPFVEHAGRGNTWLPLPANDMRMPAPFRARAAFRRLHARSRARAFPSTGRARFPCYHQPATSAQPTAPTAPRVYRAVAPRRHRRRQPACVPPAGLVLLLLYSTSPPTSTARHSSAHTIVTVHFRLIAALARSSYLRLHHYTCLWPPTISS